MEYYNIKCNVSGGVTGNRTSLLKEEGEVKFFDSKEAAEKEAARLTEKMNGNIFRTAYFRYWAVPYEGGKE